MSNDPTRENERQLLRTLLERVSQRAAAEQEIESRYATSVAGEQAQYQTVFQLLSENYDRERNELEHTQATRLAESDRRCQSESAQVQIEYQRVLAEAEDRFAREMADANKEHDESVWLVSSLLDDDTEGSPLQRFQQAETAYSAAQIELKTGIDGLSAGYDRVVRFLKRSHLWSEPTDPDPNVAMSTVEAMKMACLDAISASDPLRQRITSRLLPLLFVGLLPVVLFLGISLVLFGLIWGLVDPAILQLKLKPTDRDWLLISAGVAAAFGLLPVLFLHMFVSMKVWPDYEELLQQLINARFAHSVWERTAKTELNMIEAECSHLQELRVKRRDSAIGGAESKLAIKSTEIRRQHSAVLQHAGTAYPGRLNALETKRKAEREELTNQYQADSEDQIFRRESDFRKLQNEFDTRMNDHRRLYQQSWLELIRSWYSDLEELGERSDALCEAAREICPTWDAIAKDDLPFPVSSPSALSLGNIHADLEMIEGGISTDPRLKSDRTQFDVPLLLPLRQRPSLVLHATGAGRDAAVKTLQSTMLRFLTSLPPGKVRFTILDPVGLGANFSAFMHLADFDELLVSSRIWTEPSHIEKKLADLTEHMETVLQTYLRNEFATIDEYNQFAGEVAEPYRILVVANFPVNFTDIALRRLASIADGGQRCGVYLLLSSDKSQEIPRGFATKDLEKYASVLNWTEHGFELKDHELSAWPLALDPPPSAELFGQIVRLAGQRSRDVRRVEVPFERVAPTEDAFWASDSRSGIDVPMGRAGATKLQYLRLGKGTSQHVLVAGKTGSGKSTLLHALITNLALHYSPAEVEFYLIDFKKGVEFKVYAEQRLPHARVIAIESDREFGVSVLERLDAVLRERGELFRAAGVQDIAGYRNARPDAVMPRTLLIVDEFQEFFIEDDAMSQQASLLLDRLIRQGRAFGVHILLGSQTLAGAYSLARSTLGQVAVRIALQCSDTDAHLILSEENTAARLLTRPGEAIYNDANGLIEGNHPFQIVWLSEEEREGYLKLVRSESDGTGTRGLSTEPIQSLARIPALVFEGNIPADPTKNRRLQRALTKSRAEFSTGIGKPIAMLDLPWTCWLGDSVSLGGPVELNFGLREGGNVLIVGRDDNAALGIMANSTLALCSHAVTCGQTSTTVYVLDGSLPESLSAKTWKQLGNVWPPPSQVPSEASRPNHAQQVENLGTSSEGHEAPRASQAETGAANRTIIQYALPRETDRVIADLYAELHRRTDEPGPPLFLFIFDLARFRDLRKADDDFGFRSNFGGGDEKAVNTAQAFGEILRDGPGAGLFTIAWVDSYQSAQRWLARDQMNRFEQRILFAMNANDSSSLVDSPLAGRLGENRALIYRGDTGTLEKFRPFSPPPNDWLNQQSVPRSFASTPAIPQEIQEPAIDPVSATSASESSVVEPTEQQPPDESDASGSDIPARNVHEDLPSIDEINVQ